MNQHEKNYLLRKILFLSKLGLFFEDDDERKAIYERDIKVFEELLST